MADSRENIIEQAGFRESIGVGAIRYQRVRLAVADKVHSANFNICERLIYILRDGIADGGIAGQVERFAEVGSNMTRRDDTGLNFACINGFCSDLFRGNGSRSDVVGEDAAAQTLSCICGSGRITLSRT